MMVDESVSVRFTGQSVVVYKLGDGGWESVSETSWAVSGGI